MASADPPTLGAEAVTQPGKAPPEMSGEAAGRDPGHCGARPWRNEGAKVAPSG